MQLIACIIYLSAVYLIIIILRLGAHIAMAEIALYLCICLAYSRIR